MSLMDEVRVAEVCALREENTALRLESEGMRETVARLYAALQSTCGGSLLLPNNGDRDAKN